MTAWTCSLPCTEASPPRHQDCQARAPRHPTCEEMDFAREAGRSITHRTIQRLELSTGNESTRGSRMESSDEDLERDCRWLLEGCSLPLLRGRPPRGAFKGRSLTPPMKKLSQAVKEGLNEWLAVHPVRLNTNVSTVYGQRHGSLSASRGATTTFSTMVRDRYRRAF